MITQNEVIDLLRQGMWIAIEISAPMLLSGMVVGIVIAIFQAATQIHEQTLTFIPKAALVVGFLLLGGSWMMTALQDYTRLILEKIIG